MLFEPPSIPTPAPAPPRSVLPHLLAVGLALLMGGCGSETVTDSSESSSVQATPTRFVEVAEALGVDHVHRQPILDDKLSNIMSWMASVGAAVATADFDGDGHLDLFFTSSERGTPNRLYRGLEDGSFEEVADRAGLAPGNSEALGASMDAVWGDVDNDGDPDLYLVRWGHDSLYLNRGDGTFDDVTSSRFTTREGEPGTQWANGNAAIFLDFDRDGLLDIYVGNYFREIDLWNLEDTRIMHDDFEVARNGGRNFLYRQRDDGAFEEVATEHGVDDPGWTLAVGAGDLDGDGFLDLYSADDFGPDQLFLGTSAGGFRNVTETAIGFDTKKGMNADFGDFDNDGRLDVYVANITTAEYLQEGNMLWSNQGLDADGELVLADISLESGTYDGGWGWGAKFFDFDNDGDLDIIAANGFISAGEESYWYDLASWTVLGQDSSDASLWPPIGDRSFSGFETERLWRNDGRRSFREVAAESGLETDRDGRGVAVVDLDDDGDLDVVLANQGQEPQIFRNRTLDRDHVTAPEGAPDGAIADLRDESAAHWLRVDLGVPEGSGINRDAIGTRVVLRTGERIQVRERDGGNGFSGQSDPRLHFGLGSADRVDLLEVRWPDGTFQQLEDVAADQAVSLVYDPASLVDSSSVELPPVDGVSIRRDAAPVPEVGLAEVEGELMALEARLRDGYERAAASRYRRVAADAGAHDRAVDFLTERAEATEDAVWRIELSVAYVDKIPQCGGLGAIVCKGRMARKGLLELDQVLERYPDSWLATYSRGMNHLHWPRALRHSAPAAEDLERAVELQSHHPPEPWHERAWVALGQAYVKDGRVSEGREAWTRGLAVLPGSAALQEHLAIAEDDALLDYVLDLRSLEQGIDTDLSFYDERL